MASGAIASVETGVLHLTVDRAVDETALGGRFDEALSRLSAVGSRQIVQAGGNPIVDFLKDQVIDRATDLVIRRVDESISYGTRSLQHIGEDLVDLENDAIATDASSRILAERTGPDVDTALLDSWAKMLLREADDLRDKVEQLAQRADDIQARVEADLADHVAGAEAMVDEAQAHLDRARADGNDQASRYFEGERRRAQGILDFYRTTALEVRAHADRIDRQVDAIAERLDRIGQPLAGRVGG